MAVLRFRIYFDEDDSVYRDVVIRHKQSFFDLHSAILQGYEFDTKHQATFYRSNDSWQKGKEITLERYDKNYVVEPLMMKETVIGTQVFDTNQKFVYEYDFVKGWTFLIELINISKEEDPRVAYPAVIRKEGIAPSQYGTRSIMGDTKLTPVEEKYDLTALLEGFGQEGEDNGDENEQETEETGDDDSAQELL